MSTRQYIDPLFNNPTSRHQVKASVKVESALVSATEKPPRSPTSKQPMQLVEGAYNGKVFSMWVDVSNRLSIPVRKD
jgi:hypothetical protein